MRSETTLPTALQTRDCRFRCEAAAVSDSLPLSRVPQGSSAATRRFAPRRAAAIRPREQRATDAGEAPRLLLRSESGGLDLRACSSGHENPARGLRPAPCVRSGDPGRGPFWENAVGQAVLDDALRARAFHWAAPATCPGCT